MERKWLIGTVGLLMAFFLAACGSDGQVESLSPEEMKKYVEENDTAYILLNNTEDKEEKSNNIELVEENIESISVKEINTKSSEMLDNNFRPKDLGLKNIQFGTLGIYEDGVLKDYVSLRNADHSSKAKKEKALQQFIDENST